MSPPMLRPDCLGATGRVLPCFGTFQPTGACREDVGGVLSTSPIWCWRVFVGGAHWPQVVTLSAQVRAPKDRYLTAVRCFR